MINEMKIRDNTEQTPGLLSRPEEKGGAQESQASMECGPGGPGWGHETAWCMTLGLHWAGLGWRRKELGLTSGAFWVQLSQDWWRGCHVGWGSKTCQGKVLGPTAGSPGPSFPTSCSCDPLLPPALILFLPQESPSQDCPGGSGVKTLSPSARTVGSMPSREAKIHCLLAKKKQKKKHKTDVIL